MNNIETIPLLNLTYSLLPVIIVLIILIKWQLNAVNAIYSLCRMLAQLLMVGFFLNTIFASDSAYATLLILAVMLFFSSWIALNTVKLKRRHFFIKAIVSVLIASGFTLYIVLVGVLELKPWYQPRYTIPLGGMILANCMNSISLAAERFQSELRHKRSLLDARNQAFNAALIPIINSLFAVGLVSLPGMMTGQILSGVSPFVAARYQIMVMCMLFSSSGLSAASFLILVSQEYKVNKERGVE